MFPAVFHHDRRTDFPEFSACPLANFPVQVLRGAQLTSSRRSHPAFCRHVPYAVPSGCRTSPSVPIRSWPRRGCCRHGDYTSASFLFLQNSSTNTLSRQQPFALASFCIGVSVGRHRAYYASVKNLDSCLLTLNKQELL